METLLSTVRAVILIGAVCFAFALLIFGFHVVIREYRMLRTRKQIEDFLRLTNDSGLQADVAKGTLSLNRTRPGILLIGIGSVLLIVCVLQPFQYESSRQSDNPQTINLPTRTERQLQGATPTPGSTPPMQQSGTTESTDQKATPPQVVVAYPPPVPSRLPAPAENRDSSTRETKPAVTVESVEALRIAILEKWLGDVAILNGKKLGEQAELLRARYGEAAVGFDSFMLDRSATVPELAREAYGSAKYIALLRVSNPQLPDDETPVPAYTTLYFLQPLLALAQPATSTNRTLMRITAGSSKIQMYDRLLELAEKQLNADEYKRSPTAWWGDRGGVPEFERGLTKSTGRKWAFKFYQPEANETPETVAKIFYGSAKYVPLLAFFNYDRADLFVQSKIPFPVGSKLVIVYLAEA